MATLQAKPAGSKTLRYALITFTLCVVLLHVVLSLPVIQEHLPAQHYGTQYPVFEESMTSLEKHLAENGQVDCIVLGSSMTQSAFYPDVFAETYREQSGENISCFNFALWQLTGSSAGPLAKALVGKYHPRLLVYGTSARDYRQILEIPGEFEFPQSSWVRYHNSDFNLMGWLTDKSVIVRYYNALHNLILPAPQDSSTFVDTRDSQGFRPAIEQHPVFRDALQRGWHDEPTDHNYAIYDDDLAGLRQILDMQGDSLAVLIFEAPIHPLGIPSIGQNGTGQQLFLDTVTEETQQYGIPFWTTSHLPLIPDADWRDNSHFRITGAVQFSQWIGAQVGEAVTMGLFENPMPDAVLYEPPLQGPDLEPPYYLESKGLLPETYTHYLDYFALYDLTEPTAVILNPSTGLEARGELQMQLGFYIDWAREVDPSMIEGLFDFMIVLERMQFEDELTLDSEKQRAVDRWRQSKQARDLRAAGIDYLFYSSEWLSFTTVEENAILADTTQYELVATWQHRVTTRQYWLYRILD